VALGARWGARTVGGPALDSALGKLRMPGE